MKKQLYRKSIVVGLLVLFFGASVIPAAITMTQISKIAPLPGDRGFLLIPDSTAKSVGMYDPFEGTYLGDLIVDTTRFSTPINAVVGPDGDIYVSDQVADSVFVYDIAGNYLYTYADSSDGLDNIRGIAFRGTELFISKGGTPKCIARFSGPHTRLPDFIADGIDPFDILFLQDGRCLVADIEGSTDNVRLYNYDGVLEQILFQVNFPEQIQFDSLAPGAFLTAAFSANVIQDFELDGTIVESTPYSSGRGVFRLGNGNILATSSAGIQEIQPGTGSIIQTEKTGSGRFIEVYSTGENQPPNTPSNPDPTDGETEVALDKTLTWMGGDPDPGDYVTYDVYFGTESSPPQVASNISTAAYTPEDMMYNEHYYWRIVSWDSAGLTAEGPVWNFYTLTDVEPPTSQHTLDGTMGQNDWYISTVTITIQATDDVSGVDAIFYNINDGEWTEYTEPIEVDEDGDYTFEYYAIDNAGNEETPNSGTFKLDKTAPVINTFTATAQNALKTKWLLEADVTDATSGIVLVEFYADDAIVGNVTTPPYEFLVESKISTAQCIVYDEAGNSKMSDVVTSYDYGSQQQYYNLLLLLQQKLL